MKLSEKGENRLYNSKNVFYDDDIEGDVVALWELSKVWEFEPDDFEGAVMLTVDEACEILDYLAYLHLRGGKDSFLKELEKCNRNLYERIEQAGKENGQI